MRFVVFVFFLALGGCQTPYQPEGIGGGYEDIRLSDDTFEIRARGNGYSTEAHTRNIVLLRASELAKQNGFSHFLILDGSMKTTEKTYTSPGYSTTTGHANVYGNVNSSVYGNTVSSVYSGTAYGTSNTTYMPPQTHTIANQHGRIIAKMLNAPAPGAMDANMIYDQLHPKLAKR